VGDTLRSFEAEAKERLSGREPVFEHLRGWQGPKGVVDLDGAELRGIELKEFLGRCRGRVEGRLPCGIRPTGRPGKDACSGCAGCDLGRR
jgi:hypothetical protein